MREDGEIVVTPISSVEEQPVSSMTVEHDQGWTRGLIRKDINGAPDLLVSVLRMEPHQYHPLHRHPNMGELYYILEGRCQLRVGDRSEWVEAGTAIYTPRGIPHSTRTEDDGVSILVVFPEGDWNRIGKEFVE